jgi:hypothetical protein
MLNRLMKIAIIQNNTSRRIGLSQSQLLTKNQLECRITIQITFHLDTAID